VPPVNVHVPEIVPPVAVPERVNVFPAGDPETTVKANFPVTLPLKSPLKVKEPFSDSPDTKHGEFVLKVKLETLRLPFPFTTSEVPKVKTGEFPEFIRVAFQVPLMLPGFVPLFVAQPANVRADVSNKTSANFFMKIPRCGIRKGARSADACFSRAGGHRLRNPIA
jgi:hypothetical protein